MEIASRSEWGARPPKTTPRIISLPTPELWLHHTASPSGGPDRVRAIQRFHQDVRGWNDIAYSFLINDQGEVFEGRGPGIAGGHTAGHNTISHAICVMGHYEQVQPTQRSIDAVVELARHGHDQGWWPQKFTGGHRDASGASTSCPGRYLQARLPQINKTLEDDMPTAEEIAQKVWEYRVQNGATAALTLDRNYRNINELTIAHRAGTLGTTAMAEISDDDLAAIAKAVNDEQHRRSAQ